MQVSLPSENLRPPLARFEMRPVEDRIESEKQGLPITKDVEFIVITPAGSRDEYDFVWADWIKAREKDAATAPHRWPPAWNPQYRQLHKMWKEGEELPVNGIALRTWPGLGPSQLKSCVNARVLTVEDLAAANEETLHRIGPGARMLKARAEQFLRQAPDTAKASQIAALEEQNAALKAQLKQLQDAMTQFEPILRAHFAGQQAMQAPEPAASPDITFNDL